jgi:hypothetical protein
MDAKVRARKPRSDQADARAKGEFVRSRAAEDPEFALLVAQAILRDPTLLDGNAKIVALLAGHDEAASVLDAVFEKQARRYPNAYKAFMGARYGLR